MVEEVAFDEINEAKANMDSIYDQPDPRAYFRELRKLEYEIPGAAKPIIQRLIRHLQKSSDEPVHLLDVGSSYGVNAALIKYDLTLSELYAHWGQKLLRDVAPEDIIENDREFFGELDLAEDVEVFGLDVAENAVAFGTEVGLLTDGLSVNLETEPLPAASAKELASVNLVMSTGCVGYVTEKTFEKLLPAVSRGRRPWLANFVLRLFPFEQIAESLSDHGYVTEKLKGQTFVQRNFASQEEQEQVLDQLKGRGIDTEGKEDEGQYLAEFYLSRPSSDVARVPIERLLAA
ncbi:MAG: class I SAM-dependent methyltransferase [Hyphomicrobiaceae bacterium]